MADIDNVELKKRSRRRLVGAAALALLAAILLPMVMDQEPDSPAQDIQVTIPDRDADSALARPIASRSGPEAQLVPPPEEEAPPAAAEQARSAPAAAAVVPAQVQPSLAAAAKPAEPLEAAKPTRPSVVPPSEDAFRAKALLEGKPGAVSPSIGSPEFVVQVGAFSDIGKAAAIADELKGRGLTAYTERAGAVTRVRVGPFKGRDDAEKAAQKLRAGGMSGSVVQR